MSRVSPSPSFGKGCGAEREAAGPPREPATSASLRRAGPEPCRRLDKARATTNEVVEEVTVRRFVIAIAAITLLGSIHAVHHGGTTALHAQEGHPLTGTWTGDWASTATDRAHITVVMNWEGKAITGILNPGPDQAPLTSVTLDPATWTVHIEADAKDAS